MNTRRTRLGTFLVILVALTILVAACSEDAQTTTTTTTELAACTVDNLNLVTPGTLTIATGDPAYPPWVTDADGGFNDDPTAKSGFEAALAYEIATYLGFSDDQVVWERTGFDEAIVAGPKDWDFNMQQYSIASDRDEVVDFSVPYFMTGQALVVLEGSPYQNATTVEELKGAKLGASIGSTSIDFIETIIQPDTPPNVYDENFDVTSAMNAGQIEGLVVDTWTAYYITGSGDVPGSVVAGSFEAEDAAPDNYGLLFAEGNPLVECVNEAINALWADGTIDGLIAQWLRQGGEINVISG